MAALHPGLLPGLLVVAVAAVAPPGATEPRVYLSSWAVRVAAGPREAGGLARRHGLLCLGQVREPRNPRCPLRIPTTCARGER